MGDQQKTKTQLIAELAELRQRVAELESDIGVHDQVETALSANEPLVRALFESQPHPLYRIDRRGSLTFVNQVLLQRWGLARDQYLGRSVYDFFPPARVDEARREDDLIFRTGEAQRHIEEYHDPATDHLQFMQVIKAPVRDEAGQIVGLQGVFWEVTSYEEAQRALAKRNAELALLNEALQALTSTLNFAEVLSLVLNELRQMLKISASSIWLLDADTQELVCRDATGRQNELVRGWRMPKHDGFAGWVVEHNQSLIVTDAQTDERHFQGVDRRTGLAMRSIISVPLHSEQQVIGVIQAVDVAPGRFSTEDLRLTELLATAASAAIENARLFEKTWQRAERLVMLNELSTALNTAAELQEVLQIAVDNLTRVLKVDQTGLALMAEGREHLTLVADVPAAGSPSLMGWPIPVRGNPSMEYILENKAPLAILDVPHDPLLESIRDVMIKRRIQSMLLVPLLQHGEVIGTIGCDALHAPRHFTAEDIELATTVANLIIARIEQARLFSAERYQRVLAETLRDSAEALSRNLQFDDVLDTILDSIERIVPYDAANVMLMDNAQQAYVVRARGYSDHGGADVMETLRLSIPDTPPLRQIYETRQPLAIPSVAEFAGWHQTPGLEWERSYIGVPVESKGQVIGFLQATSATPGYYREADALRLRAFADQAALAIDKARLYAEVESHARELEQRVAERTRDLMSANERLKDLDRMKDQFISRISHELRTPLANVKLYADLLENGWPEKRSQYLETLNHEADRLDRLIEDLLDVSYLSTATETIELFFIDMNHFARDLLTDRREMAQTRGLTLECALEPQLPVARASLPLLARAVSSLLTNAINYTFQGGITILTGAQRVDCETWVTLTVRDTGVGIDPQELDRIFDRFYRGQAASNYKIPGAGLGLSIAQANVERMGGRITVESEPGKGSAFTVWLRAVPPPAESLSTGSG